MVPTKGTPGKDEKLQDETLLKADKAETLEVLHFGIFLYEVVNCRGGSFTVGETLAYLTS